MLFRSRRLRARDPLAEDEAGDALAESAPEVDYDTYAEGEALLGWLNVSVMLRSDSEIDGNELLRALADRRPVPTEDEVAAAIQRRVTAANGVAPLVPLGHRRNLHVILEESFFDPTVLSGANYSEDPIDPRYDAVLAVEIGRAHV